MSKQQIEEIRELVEGIVAGRMIDAYQSNHEYDSKFRERVKRVSHNAGAYVAGQLREVAA